MRRSPDDPALIDHQDAVVTNNATRSVSHHLERGRDRDAARLGVALLSDIKGEAMEPLDQLDTLGPLLAGVVSNITSEQLDNDTPCEKFAVRDVLDHMIEGATAFAAAFRGDANPPVAPTGDQLTNFGPVLTALADAMHAPGALERTIQAPFGAVPGDTFARFVVLDGLVHGWDMAVATGQPYEPPASLVEAATAFGTDALDPLRDGETFAAATTAPTGASPIERLAALTGRRVNP